MLPTLTPQTLPWIALALGVVWAVGALIGLLSPILAPFFLAAIFAYIGNPLVGKLAARRVPRAAGAVLVIVAGFALLVAMIGIFIPLVQEESARLAARLPSMVESLGKRLTPWLPPDVHFNAQTVREFLSSHSDRAPSIAQGLIKSLGSGGAVVMGVLSTLLIAPVVMFYLMRDWNEIGASLATLIPRPAQTKTLAMLHAIDDVLAEFLRGQLSVMAALAVFYSVALALCGMEYALPVGVLTGVLVFIPYIGFASGLVLSILISLQQDVSTLVAVLAVFGVGQVLETFVLTPRLVGNRIGLHPLVVIFALMAFGELFGFVGVLLALPASAVLLVGLREVRAHYLSSTLYTGGTQT